MSETTNHVVLEVEMSAKFGKCRKSFLCRFQSILVVSMSFLPLLFINLYLDPNCLKFKQTLKKILPAGSRDGFFAVEK